MRSDANTVSSIFRPRLSLLFHERNRSFRFIQYSLLFVIGLLTFTFEFYYQYGYCAVSEEYSRKNIQLAHKAMDMLDTLSIPHWPDFQSLLNVLRNETYNIWDPDADISIEWPLTTNPPDPKFNQIEILIQHIKQCGFRVDFHPNRKLIQLKFPDDTSKDQSHVDIWLWTRKYLDEKEMVLEHVDYTIKYKTRFVSHIYPLRPAKWLGRNITIPCQSDIISYKEYGASYTKATVFRKDCLHNLIHGRWM